MSRDVAEVLKNHELFKLLSDDLQQRLIEACKIMHFEDGDKIITEGEFNEFLHLIIEGKVHIVSGEDLIAMVEPEDVMGEISSSGMSSPVADVIAEGKVTTIAFPLEMVTDISIESPDFGEELRHIGMKRFE